VLHVVLGNLPAVLDRLGSLSEVVGGDRTFVDRNAWLEASSASVEEDKEEKRKKRIQRETYPKRPRAHCTRGSNIWQQRRVRKPTSGGRTEGGERRDKPQPLLRKQ
jgi:hypothetical protein